MMTTQVGRLRLRELMQNTREALDLSQEKFAWKAGVSTSTIKNLEQWDEWPDRGFNAKTLRKVEVGLGWSVGSIMAIAKGQIDQPQLEQPVINALHLPECPKYFDRYAMARCMCDPLRACEQRVGESAYEIGYRNGLEAAREAVRGVQEDSVFVRIDDALDAIDALKEKP